MLWCTLFSQSTFIIFLHIFFYKHLFSSAFYIYNYLAFFFFPVEITTQHLEFMQNCFGNHLNDSLLNDFFGTNSALLTLFWHPQVNDFYLSQERVVESLDERHKVRLLNKILLQKTQITNKRSHTNFFWQVSQNFGLSNLNL